MSFAIDAIPAGFQEEEPHLRAAASPTPSSHAGFPAVCGTMAFVSTTGEQNGERNDPHHSRMESEVQSPATVLSNRGYGTGAFTNAGVLALTEETKRHMSVEDRPSRYNTVPWDQRDPVDSDSRGVLNLGLFTITPHVFMRFDFALRQTFLGVLPAALLMLEEAAASQWIDRQGEMILIVCIVCMQTRLGYTVEHVILIWAALLVYVPIAAIAIAINPARNAYGWYALYAFLILVISTFTRGLVTKMCLFFFTVTYVLHRSNKVTIRGIEQNPEFPLHFIVPCLIGTGFAVCASLLPYPRTYRQMCESRFETVFSGISICIEGCCRSVWSPDALERRANRATLRSTRRSINYAVVEAKNAVEMMLMEPWSREVQARAQSRLVLIDKLLTSVDGMLLYIDGLSKNGGPIDNSDAAQRWGQAFVGSMMTGCQYVEELLTALPDLATGVEQPQLDRLNTAQQIILTGYHAGRKYAMSSPDWVAAKTSEDVNFPFVSLGFFLFNFGQIFATLQNHKETIDGIEHPLQRMAMWPVRGVLGIFYDIRDLAQLKTPMLLRLREALKLTFAMWFAMLLLQYIGVPDPAAGASVIGFIKDADPTTTVIVSTEFMLAAAIGCMLGYVTGSVSRDLTEICIWMCVLAFVFGFGKSGSRYGSVSFLTQFFALTTISAVHVSQGATLIRIQQNVAAMMWLAVTHVVLFPIWPSNQVQNELHAAIEKTRDLLIDVCVTLQTSDASAGDKLYAMRARLVESCDRVRAYLPHATSEPDVRKLPFPEHQTRNLLHAVEALVALIGPAIAAVIHEAQHHPFKEQPKLSTASASAVADASSSEPIELTKPIVDQDETLPAVVFQELQKSMGLMTLVIDEFMRGMALADGPSVRVVDSATANLVHLHSRVESASVALVSAAHEAFFRNAHIAKPSPFRMPALHVTVHYFHLLPACLNTLLTAAIEYDKARTLRG